MLAGLRQQHCQGYSYQQQLHNTNMGDNRETVAQVCIVWWILCLWYIVDVAACMAVAAVCLDMPAVQAMCRGGTCALCAPRAAYECSCVHCITSAL